MTALPTHPKAERACGLGRARSVASGLLAIPLAAAIIMQMLNDPSLARTEANEALGQLRQANTAEEYAEVESLAKRALNREPLESRAASVLGLLRDKQENSAEARKLILAASKLSHRNDQVDLWLFNDGIRRRDYDQAFLHADAVLRRRPALVQRILPAMFAKLDDPAAVEAVAKRMALGPQWRNDFLGALFSRFDPALAFPILAAMQKAGGQPIEAELSSYLNRLVAAGRYETAYLNWIIFLPPAELSRLSNVFDGDFNGWSAAQPFGWNLGGGIGGNAAISDAPDRNSKALYIQYDGYSTPPLPRQLIVLPAGAYRFAGEIQTMDDMAVDKVEWTVRCAEDDRALISVPSIDTKGRWQKFHVNFTVPPGQCSAQWLALTPKAGLRRTSIAIWYDRLTIDLINETPR